MSSWVSTTTPGPWSALTSGQHWFWLALSSVGKKFCYWQGQSQVQLPWVVDHSQVYLERDQVKGTVHFSVSSHHCLQGGLPRWLSGKNSAYQCRGCRRIGLYPWVGKIPWRRKWQPTPVFLENPIDGGAWWVHGVTKSWIRLSAWTKTASKTQHPLQWGPQVSTDATSDTRHWTASIPLYQNLKVAPNVMINQVSVSPTFHHP